MYIIGGLILLIVTSVKAFQVDHLGVYEQQALKLANKTIIWVQAVAHMDRSTFINEIQQEFDFTEILKGSFVIVYSRYV